MSNEINNMIAASPQQMAQQAQLLKKSCNSILSSLNHIKEYMSQISSYWDTQGAKVLKDIFQSDTQEALALSSRLSRRLSDLDSIIANYETAENISTQEAAELPDSIFS